MHIVTEWELKIESESKSLIGSYMPIKTIVSFGSLKVYIFLFSLLLFFIWGGGGMVKKGEGDPKYLIKI